MGKSTFLTEEQLWGDKQSNIIKAKGNKVKPTPYAILLGAEVDDAGYGYSWTTSTHYDGSYCVVSPLGDVSHSRAANSRRVAARPASFSNKSEISPNRVKNKGKDGIWEIEEYEYPHSIVSDEIAEILNSKGPGVIKSKYVITRDTRKCNEFNKGFKGKEQPIWEYDGKRYIKVTATLSEEHTVINGKIYNSGDKVWVEIQPQKEWYDPKTGERLTQEAVFAGVQINLSGYYYGVLTNTDMQRNMLDKYDEEKIVKPKTKTSTFGLKNLVFNSLGLEKFVTPKADKEKVKVKVITPNTSEKNKYHK